MANIDVIRSYLVELGFDINNTQLRQFNNALRAMAANVERFTTSPLTGIAGMFAKAGMAVVGTLASIAGGTAIMLSNVAQSDLQMQMFARRMFISTSAARGMKMALDELGYSLEDVVWGPPELRQRFGALVGIEQRMMAGMGGEKDFQQQMRRIRDIQFEFTKFSFEAKMFTMGLAGKLGKALFGDDEGLVKKLGELNSWFQLHAPEIEQELTNKLVPVLKDVYGMFKDMVEIAKKIPFKAIADDAVYLTHKLRELVDFVSGSKDAQQLLGYVGKGALLGSAVPGVGTLGGATIGALTGLAANATQPAWDKFSKDPKQAANVGQYKLWAMQYAAKYKLDPFLLMSLIQRESSWNPTATNPTSGAFGFGQFMPKNMQMFGMNARDPQQNIEMTAHYLSELVGKYGVQEALKRYGGFETKDPSAYINDILKGRDLMKRGDLYHPSAYSAGSTVNVGGVTVIVKEPHATAEQIAAKVSETLSRKQDWEIQRVALQSAVTYA